MLLHIQLIANKSIMASKLRRIIPVMEYLLSLNTRSRNKFIKGAKAAVIQQIVDVLYNVNIGTIQLDSVTVDQLRPYKRNIKAVCAPKKSLMKRRLELIKGDRIFGKALPILIPELIKFIVPRVTQSQEKHGVDAADNAATPTNEIKENVVAE